MHAGQSIVDGAGEEWKRALNVIALGFLLVVSASWCALSAQEPAPRNQFTVDASALAGGLSYARMTSSDRLVGVGAGLGYEFNIRLVVGETGGRSPRKLRTSRCSHDPRHEGVGSTTSASRPLLTSTARRLHPRPKSAAFLASTSRRCGVGATSVSDPAFRREPTGRPPFQRSESSSRRSRRDSSSSLRGRQPISRTRLPSSSHRPQRRGGARTAPAWCRTSCARRDSSQQ